MPLTVTEKEHWRQRIAAKIERRIETPAAGDPGLMDRVKAEARRRAIASLGLAESQAELDAVVEERKALDRREKRAQKAMVARLQGVPAEEVADELIERLGLADVADDRVDSLPTGRARLVELGRALANGPRVLLLDEVSSGLNESETEAMAVVLRSLAEDGIGILLVEHDMSLVMSTCHDIHVLDFGEIIAQGTPEEIQANEAVQEAYLGEGVAN